MNKVAIGCASLAAVVVGSIVVFVIWMSRPIHATIAVDAPGTVAEGERFEIQARLTNTSGRAQTWKDLDIADAYLAGVMIEGSDPPYKEGFHVPIDNTFSYSFDLPVPPDSEVVITLHAYAAHFGDFSGEFDFCVDSELRCISYPIRTIVRERVP